MYVGQLRLRTYRTSTARAVTPIPTTTDVSVCRSGMFQYVSIRGFCSVPTQPEIMPLRRAHSRMPDQSDVTTLLGACIQDSAVGRDPVASAAPGVPIGLQYSARSRKHRSPSLRTFRHNATIRCVPFTRPGSERQRPRSVHGVLAGCLETGPLQREDIIFSERHVHALCAATPGILKHSASGRN